MRFRNNSSIVDGSRSLLPSSFFQALHSSLEGVVFLVHQKGMDSEMYCKKYDDRKN